MALALLGLTLLKFFPAANYGGAGTLKAFSSVFAKARFIPTGGVSESNIGDYLSLPNVPAVGGSWMVRPEWLAEGRYDEVAETARRSRAAISLPG
jgi:2-dehydro-3-deoxyphosphogluconate aldolase/(4S)-4-hydroxy-2-oxoglutarate aldolase